MTVELRKAVPVTSIIFTYWFEHCLASSFWKELRESIGRALWDTLCHAMAWAACVLPWRFVIFFTRARHWSLS
jgi:hypothetical protein